MVFSLLTIAAAVLIYGLFATLVSAGVFFKVAVGIAVIFGTALWVTWVPIIYVLDENKKRKREVKEIKGILAKGIVVKSASKV